MRFVHDESGFNPYKSWLLTKLDDNWIVDEGESPFPETHRWLLTCPRWPDSEFGRSKLGTGRNQTLTTKDTDANREFQWWNRAYKSNLLSDGCGEGENLNPILPEISIPPSFLSDIGKSMGFRRLNWLHLKEQSINCSERIKTNLRSVDRSYLQ